ncbi:MAG: hypothetical protein Q8P31_08515 [Bacillota bacterium]|nr:hypothetical protein [Bacillota bacterium]
MTMGLATELAIEACNLGVRNIVAGLDGKTWYSHGDTLRINVCNEHPVAWGMPEEGLAFSWDTAVFEITERFNPDHYEVVASYPEKDILQSGWLVGEDRIAGQPAVVRARYGDGDCVLIGFKCQNRGQTHGTYKLLFNCLL